MIGSCCIGNRVELRPLGPGDDRLLAQWGESEGAWSTLGYAPRVGMEGDVQFAVIARAIGRAIGVAGLHRLCPGDRTASLGIFIADQRPPEHGCLAEIAELLAGRGFEQLQLNRLELAVVDGRQRDVYACWGAGFEFEGRARQAIFRDGSYRDVVRYGLVRARWQGLRRVSGTVETNAR